MCLECWCVVGQVAVVVVVVAVVVVVVVVAVVAPGWLLTCPQVIVERGRGILLRRACEPAEVGGGEPR